MHPIEEFVDERQRGWCVHCVTWIGSFESNLDHVPSKTLLRKPFPEHLPKVPVCKSCNAGFSLDEEYVAALLGCVLVGSTDPERQSDARKQRALKRNPRLRNRIEAARLEERTLFDESTRVVWAPERSRIERVILKNARGHAYFEFGEPMLDAPAHVWFAPLDLLDDAARTQFEDVEIGSLWPEMGSRMLTRVATGQDLANGWVVAQDDVYRYAVLQQGRLLVRSVLSEYLATEVLWD